MNPKDKIYFLFVVFKHLFFHKKYCAIIDITNKCNLRCKHCYNKEIIKKEDKTSIKEWRKRFTKYQKMGVRLACFAGGEPSLRYDVLKVAEEYFPFIVLFSNGQKKIPEEYRHRIFLSLDGLKEENDNVRGKGTFKRAIDNYKGDKRVVVCCILSRINYKGKKRFKEFIEKVRKMNISGLYIDTYIPQFGEDDSLVLKDEQYKEIGEILIEELRRNNSIIYITKKLIDYQTKKDTPLSKCRIKENYLISHNDKFKRCVGEKNDCSRCRVFQRYAVPFYKVVDWFQLKIMTWHYLFKM